MLIGFIIKLANIEQKEIEISRQTGKTYRNQIGI